MNKKNRHTLMWCGRFLDWKHPDDAIFVARKLKADGYSFQLKFVGTGDMEEKLKDLVEENDLSDCVIFLGSMKPEQVREHMEEAGIYLFTSDYREGWGAVLNESMNSGCAVVASHAIGSVPFLLRDGENGYVYRSNDKDMLYEKVKYLLNHPEEQIRLGEAAYETMSTVWNAPVSAERLMGLLRRVMAGDTAPDIFDDGPCSKASVISDKWRE
jgi:glycosyltransferase involved in cell wall biosynthesis